MFFFQLACFLYTRLILDGGQIQIHSHFCHMFWSSCEYLVSKVKILVLIEWPRSPPPPKIKNKKIKKSIIELLSLEWLSCFEQVVQHTSFLLYVLGATPNHIPLKYSCPIKISNQIRHISLILTFQVLESE